MSARLCARKRVRLSPFGIYVVAALVVPFSQARSFEQLGRPSHASLAEGDRFIYSRKGRAEVRSHDQTITFAPRASTYLASYWESCVQHVNTYVSSSSALNGRFENLSFERDLNELKLPSPILFDALFQLVVDAGGCTTRFPLWVWVLLATWVVMGIRLPIAPRERSTCSSRLSLPYRNAPPIGLLALQLYLLMELGETWGNKAQRTVTLSTLKGGTYLCHPSIVGEVLVSHYESDFERHPPRGFRGLVKEPNRLSTLMPGLADGRRVRTWRLFLAILRWLANLSAGSALLALRWDESKRARPSSLTQLFLLLFTAISLYLWGLHGALDERHRYRMFPWVAMGILIACAFSWDASTNKWLSQWVLLCAFIPPYFCSGVDKFLYSSFWAGPAAHGGRHTFGVLKEVLGCWGVGHPLTTIVDQKGFPWARHFFKEFPVMAPIGGVGTLSMELAMPILSLFHNDLRIIFGGVVICFHFGVFCITAIDFKEFMLISLIFVMGVDWRPEPPNIPAEKAMKESPKKIGEASESKSPLYLPLCAVRLLLAITVIPHAFQLGPLRRSSGGETLIAVMATARTCGQDPIFWLFVFAIVRTNLSTVLGNEDADVGEKICKPKAEVCVRSPAPLARLEEGLRESILANGPLELSLAVIETAFRILPLFVVVPLVVGLLFSELSFLIINLVPFVAVLVVLDEPSERIRKVAVLTRDFLLIITPLCWLSVIFETRVVSFPYSVFPMFGSYC